MKKILALALVLCMAIGCFAGCSIGKGKTVEISFWEYNLDEERQAHIDGVIAEFQKAYPNIKITHTSLPWDGGPEKVNTAIASGTTPDLMLDADMRVSGYAGKGVLVPLNDIIASAGKNIPDNYKNAVAMNGNQYMFPVFTSGASCVIINEALAEELGVADMLPEDKVSWTWDEFEAFARAAAEAGAADGVYGVGFFAGSQSSDSSTLSWLMGGGDKILTDDYSAVAINTEKAQTILGKMAALVEDGVAYPGAATMIDDDMIGLFANSKMVACQYGDFGTAFAWNEQADAGELPGPMHCDNYMIPSLDGTPGNVVSFGATGFYIFNNKDEKKIEAAKTFISWLMDGAARETGFLEVREATPCRGGLTLSHISADRAAAADRISPYSYGNWGSQLPFWAEVRTVFWPEIQAVYSGDKTPAEALAAFETAANKIIADNS